MGSEIAQPLLRISDRGQETGKKIMVHLPLADQQGRGDEHAFIGRIGDKTHGAGIPAPHIRMMGPGYRVKERGAASVVHCRNKGYIRQMAAAVEWVVGHDHIARCKRVGGKDMPQGHGHGAEMDRDMGRLGDEVAPAVKDGAGKIPPFLDIGGKGGAGEDNAHFLGNGGKELVEDFNFDDIHRRLSASWPWWGGECRYPDMPARCPQRHLRRTRLIHSSVFITLLKRHWVTSMARCSSSSVTVPASFVNDRVPVASERNSMA